MHIDTQANELTEILKHMVLYQQASREAEMKVD